MISGRSERDELRKELEELRGSPRSRGAVGRSIDRPILPGSGEAEFSLPQRKTRSNAKEDETASPLDPLQIGNKEYPRSMGTS